jgi:predicted metal-dependent hydrolase
LHEGLARFNAGKFWEAHEAWEQIWRRHAEPWRFFIQGLIQAAAGHHQLRRGIHHGAVKHLKNALAKLEVAPPDFAGLAMEEFRAQLRKLVAEIEHVAPEEFGAYKNLAAARLQSREPVIQR